MEALVFSRYAKKPLFSLIFEQQSHSRARPKHWSGKKGQYVPQPRIAFVGSKRGITECVYKRGIRYRLLAHKPVQCFTDGALPPISYLV